MNFIVEFDKSLTKLQRETILNEFDVEHLGNIFGSFELVTCSEIVAEELKKHESILTVEIDGYSYPTDVEPAVFPTHFINVLGNAHAKGYKGNGVVVAVIDSGINLAHEDLQFELFKCARIIDNTIVSVDVLNDVVDSGGHGTAVASIIAMQDNDKGYIGVAPKAKMMIIKAATGGSMSYSSQAKSIRWAVDNGANVINISYSQPSANSTIRSACEYAYERNISVLASAGNTATAIGNTATTTQNVNMWKDYKGVLTIGGVTTVQNFNGKVLPEMPFPSKDFEYVAMYFNSTNNRYRIIGASNPLTIEKGNSNYEFHIRATGINVSYDLRPLLENKWITNRGNNSTTQNYDFSLGASYPNFLYSTHEIINNRDDGVVQSNVVPLEVFKEHYVTNFGSENFDETNPKHVVKFPTSAVGDGIDFVAPNVFNVSKHDDNETYRVRTGTSFASPYVAGMVALLRQRLPNITVDEIYALLKDNAISVGDGNVNHYGNGLVTMPDLSDTFVKKIYHKGKEKKLEKYLHFSIGPLEEGIDVEQPVIETRMKCKSINLLKRLSQ